ncbi:phosphate acyltransferase PlsX [Loigolactobacillus backii]|uniref:Phosphate acyltransferase n=1 Tax=Loigolactobacillus backii TaxID=375175 RepID=A0A192H458_9LACO|nr:phosphate acyltransferase PlsX [Loigolactobacillus backii]ANK63038.1 phosphate acyltransferase [Loigolactobacillus backii]ANK69954.1 phosphate acyltransferase [Loigolactobacillus backii]MDA5388333.1 phosphate acyltransferase PlsX [Loigolactobacillus backii]MDA5390821.1 phosphate acyltransferase PlsX [Loigolactobacillus backii]PIO83296.1 phosphate acyltransferase [Loigolactobacillus backii]
MKLAVDAMGGDNAPKTIIEGVERARDKFPDIEFQLYGDEKKIRAEIKSETRLTVVPTTEEILDTEEPVRAVRRKKDASMVVAAQAVKAGKADAIFSAGSTGALLASGLFIIGRIKGIDRPGLMPTLPDFKNDGQFNILDIGANADTKPDNLYQYAVLGNYYAKNMRQIDNPRIALLNNGTEPEKGDLVHKAAYQLLAANPDLNFIGNIEARELLNGAADVVVTDGFTGNAALKSIEGTAMAVMRLLKKTILASGTRGKLGGLLLKPSLNTMRDAFDYSRYGGAVLLGLQAPVVKTHGTASPDAVYYTVSQIRDMVQNNVVTDVVDYFGKHQLEKHPENK